MPSRFHHDALFKQGRDVIGEGLGTANVGNRDLGAAVAQKKGRRQARFTQADDQNFLAFELHHGLYSSGCVATC